ncbi:hypothetical protein I6F35_35400 [Bradyrhizobium sp. BRP22]|uniref:hypothetical protein n=1 Tax=Bradyrhizobium sp. BRP22 TaxID=2793821 RepID=UPI001CD24F36|nr:hypothetical protein [Bradyrhizobium sp. BRP22]MCA1458404.1 hypothetical protein [Bradyrhizobium sp. BRP22]
MKLIDKPRPNSGSKEVDEAVAAHTGSAHKAVPQSTEILAAVAPPAPLGVQNSERLLDENSVASQSARKAGSLKCSNLVGVSPTDRPFRQIFR